MFPQKMYSNLVTPKIARLQNLSLNLDYLDFHANLQLYTVSLHI
jgi:hypothetical protein